MRSEGSERRILSLWLPSFATDRLRRADRPVASDRPLATVRAEGGRALIAVPDAAARAAGIVPGLPLADARALRSDLHTVEADPAADARALAALADWCGCYTPVVALDGSDGLWLDITGCAHLFGGEHALLADLRSRLDRLGFASRAAIAETPGAAWALARYDGDPVIPAGAVAAAIAGLPVAGLRLPEETVAALHRVGLRRIGDLYALPRAPLAARFGPLLLRRLDMALDRLFEPVSPRLPVPPYRVRLAFPEPVGRPEDIALAARRLIEALCTRLERERLGVRRLELTLYGVDGRIRRAAAGTSRPVRDPDHLLRLLREPLAAVDLDGGTEVAILTAPRTEPLAPLQLRLGRDGADAAADPAALGLLIDRLSARLGQRNVVRQMLHESHIPERAVRLLPALRASSPAGRPWPAARPRPVRLLSRPEPIEAVALLPDAPPALFSWRRIAHRVRRADGPERIAPEWWRDGPDLPAAARTRDYYCLEDTGGRRFWIFREGLYLPEAQIRPGWFLHGVFA